MRTSPTISSRSDRTVMRREVTFDNTVCALDDIRYQISVADARKAARTEFLTATSGTGLMYHVFDHYGPLKKSGSSERVNGVLISNGTGKALGYALFNLQERGQMLIDPGTDVYEGMLIGVHSRDNDLVVNPLKGKQLTNVRAAGKDDNILLTPPLRFSLEQALEFIDEDELVEITPKSIRLRKKLLHEHKRKSAARRKAG